MSSAPPKKASQTDWHPADIKAALEKAGWTLKALAQHHGLRSSTPISHTFLRSYPANERRIAEAIGVHPKDIWPSRYHADGSPKKRGIRGMRCDKSSSANCHGNGNSVAAAA